MKVPTRPVQFVLIACLVTFGSIGCAQEYDSSTRPLEPLAADISESLTDVTESQIPGVGRVLTRTVGWQIPQLQSDKTEQATPIAKTLDGVEVTVDQTIYPQEFGSMRAPADATAAIRLGHLNVHKVFEYKIKGRSFAYAFTVNRLYIDKESGAITGSQGVLMNYVIYDGDGDSLFETLVPTDKTFNTTLRPHVPKWALRKKR